MTARYPETFAMEESASICARLIRGTESMASALIFRSVTLSSGFWVTTERWLKMHLPSVGRLPHQWAVRPSAQCRYSKRPHLVRSKHQQPHIHIQKVCFAPALLSMQTSKPSLINFATVSGVPATRLSPVRLSLGIPILMASNLLFRDGGTLSCSVQEW